MCAASQTGGSEVYSQTLLKNAIPDSTRLSIDNHTAFTSSLCVNQYSKHSCLPELKHIPIHQPSRMATQARVLATNSALQKHQPSAFQEHSLSLQRAYPVAFKWKGGRAPPRFIKFTMIISQILHPDTSDSPSVTPAYWVTCSHVF